MESTAFLLKLSTATCIQPRALFQIIYRAHNDLRKQRKGFSYVSRAQTRNDKTNFVISTDPSTSITNLPISGNQVIPIATVIVAALSWYFWKASKQGKRSKFPLSNGASPFDAAIESGVAQDGREYRMALARTRQAVAVHRAIGFLNNNNIARAMVELRRALHENSVCRSPVLNTQHEASQLQQLYRLHLENTAQPVDFATLLQLRTMLDLDFDVAENLEKEVMEQSSAYSI